MYRRLSTSGASVDQSSASLLNDSTFVRPPSTVMKAVGLKRLFWDEGIGNVSIATKLPLRSNSDVKDKKTNLLFKYGSKSAVFIEILGSDHMDVDDEEDSGDASADPHDARKERSAKKKADFSYFKRRRRNEAGDDDEGDSDTSDDDDMSGNERESAYDSDSVSDSGTDNDDCEDTSSDENESNPNSNRAAALKIADDDDDDDEEPFPDKADDETDDADDVEHPNINIVDISKVQPQTSPARREGGCLIMARGGKNSKLEGNKNNPQPR